MVTSVTDRQRNHQQFEDAIRHLQNKLQLFVSETAEVEKNTEKYGHLTSDEKKKFAQTLHDAQKYLNELIGKQQQANKKKDVPVLGEVVYKFCNKLEDVSLN